MTAPQLVEHAQGLGVTLWREGDALRYRGPAGKLSPKTLQRLAELKPALLPLLPESPETLNTGRSTSGPKLAEVGRGNETPCTAHNPMHVEAKQEPPLLGREVEALLGMQLLCLASDEGRLPSSVFPSLICPSGRRVGNPAVAVRGMLQRLELHAEGARIGRELAGADLADWPYLSAWWQRQGV